MARNPAACRRRAWTPTSCRSAFMYRVTGPVLAAATVVCLAAALGAQQETPTAPPGKALVIVRVQADAVVIIDGRATNQKGPERKFVTPVLEPGATYAFEIDARWEDMDQER